MLKKPQIAISVGDLNGVGMELALKSHNIIKQFCRPLYFINMDNLNQAAKLLNTAIPSDFEIMECGEKIDIKPGKISKKSGRFSFTSFKVATEFAIKNRAALLTLPINKAAWAKAGIRFVGHTDYLSHRFNKNAIMMLGCEKLFVALFSDHLPLKKASKKIKKARLAQFLLDFYCSTGFSKIGVLAFNPHASDNGAIGGSEEKEITKAIKSANSVATKLYGAQPFTGPLVPDAAFTPNALKSCNRLVAMYHDGGLAPLKALYFDRAINVSLNLPIVRTSPDHGTAFDIAYKGVASNLSYINAARYATKLITKD